MVNRTLLLVALSFGLVACSESTAFKSPSVVPAENATDQKSTTDGQNTNDDLSDANGNGVNDDQSSTDDNNSEEHASEQGQNTAGENESTDNVIEDISCNVSYPLDISNILANAESQHVIELADKDKTRASAWSAPSLQSNLTIELKQAALVKSMVITWKNHTVAHLFNIFTSKDTKHWQLVNNVSSNSTQKLIPEVIDLTNNGNSPTTAGFIKVELEGDNLSQPSEILEIEVFGCQQDVHHTIELIDWYLSVPTDVDNNGKSDSIKENDLAEGYYDPRFFSLSDDGGIVFSTSVTGHKTSSNTKYVRTELREMLRRGNSNFSTQGINKNNWVFSSAPQSDLNIAGGINGRLDAELEINKVTTTGENYQIGRVIIGQIHANDDEPARLYYRKLPNNENGSIYLAHEALDGNDTYYEIIGSRSDNADNPVDGIPLHERFSYSIDVTGNLLTVTITKADGSEYIENVDMTDSGYDIGGQYMYFKAGVYNQNNSGDQHDYVQATFFQIDNTHLGYQQ
jgi:hypothetical protein